MNDKAQPAPLPMRQPLQISRPPLRPTEPSDVAQRTAAAFAEIKALEETHARMAAENADLHRRLDQCANKIELLQAELDKSQERADIFQRKLVRLAAAMSGINALTADAAAIMRDVKEVEEAQAETARRQSEREQEQG